MRFRLKGNVQSYFIYGIITGAVILLNNMLQQPGSQDRSSLLQQVQGGAGHDTVVDEAEDMVVLEERNVQPAIPRPKDQFIIPQILKSNVPRIGAVAGNSTPSEVLFHTQRVICWIPTSPFMFFKRSVYVLQTWGKRCNKIFFFMSPSKRDARNWQEQVKRKDASIEDEHLNYNNYKQENLHIVEMDSAEKGSWDLTKKVFSAWTYLHMHHVDDAEWFLKVDDDSYVIMENLRYFLSRQDPNEKVYWGHKFSVGPHIYHSGGAGYVMSRATLGTLVNNYHARCDLSSGVEDIQMGKCMRALGVQVGESRDDQGRAYFYPLGPAATLNGKYPMWFNQYDQLSSRHIGIMGFPKFPISFHYVAQNKMLELELFLYYVQVYGGAIGEDIEETVGDQWLLPAKPLHDEMARRAREARAKRLAELRAVRERLAKRKAELGIDQPAVAAPQAGGQQQQGKQHQEEEQEELEPWEDPRVDKH